jgi:redox-sensitive bicupin YhaK (pirin superfamily)
MNAISTFNIRRAGERGRTRIDWLDSFHTFSFGDYVDPHHMGFSDLRVINDDIIAPDSGFGMHGHRDMEIVTIVLKGQLEHKDSLGNGAIIRPGDVQRMSAGTGVRHSEFNPSHTEPVHLLQIWILPERPGITPGYEQRSFSDADKQGRFRLIASPDGRESSVTIHQDAELLLALLSADQSVSYLLPAHRSAWLHVATGSITLNGETLEAGDALGLSGTGMELAVQGLEPDSQVLLFNLRA